MMVIDVPYYHSKMKNIWILVGFAVSCAAQYRLREVIPVILLLNGKVLFTPLLGVCDSSHKTNAEVLLCLLH